MVLRYSPPIVYSPTVAQLLRECGGNVARGTPHSSSHHPAATQATRDRPQERLSNLVWELTPEVFATAAGRGQALDLEDVAAEVLRKQEIL